MGRAAGLRHTGSRSGPPAAPRCRSLGRSGSPSPRSKPVAVASYHTANLPVSAVVFRSPDAPGAPGGLRRPPAAVAAAWIFGPAGLMNHSAVGRFGRDAKTLEISGGTSEAQCLLTARSRRFPGSRGARGLLCDF
ncbi:MAG TPA: acyl-CoA dehydrogenase family protein [Trebonia sp.]